MVDNISWIHKKTSMFIRNLSKKKNHLNFLCAEGQEINLTDYKSISIEYHIPILNIISGVSSLYAFIQFNWTGPRELKISEDKSYLDNLNIEEKIACERLSVDSIEFSTIPRQPKLLLLARFLLSANCK